MKGDVWIRECMGVVDEVCKKGWCGSWYHRSRKIEGENNGFMIGTNMLFFLLFL